MDTFFQGEDSENSANLSKEQARIFERGVVITRFSGYSGGKTDAGEKPVRANVAFTASMQFRQLTGKEISDSGGLYAFGDIEGKCRSPIYGADNIGGSQADKMILDGQNYTLVGKPYPVWEGGITFYIAVWHRAN